MTQDFHVLCLYLEGQVCVIQHHLTVHLSLQAKQDPYQDPYCFQCFERCLVRGMLVDAEETGYMWRVAQTDHLEKLRFFVNERVEMEPDAPKVDLSQVNLDNSGFRGG